MEEKIGELIASQQSMRSQLQSNNEAALGVQNTHKEHKASMDKMIKQVSQLADSISEMKRNLGRVPFRERVLDKAKEGEITLRLETSCKEPELKISPGEYEKVKDVEDALVEESNPDEAELVAESQHEKALKEDSKEATEAPDGGMKKEEPIDHLGKPEVTLLCLQTIMLPPFSKSRKGLTSGETGEDPKHEINKLETPVVQTETSSPSADKQEECDKEGRYGHGGKRNGKGAARQIGLGKLVGCPKLIESKDPSSHSLCPMEKRNIKGTFKNHKKRKVTTLDVLKKEPMGRSN